MRTNELLNGRARRELYPAALLLALLGSWAATADSKAFTAESPAFRKDDGYHALLESADQGLAVHTLACRDLFRTPAEAWCEPVSSPGLNARADAEGSSL